MSSTPAIDRALSRISTRGPTVMFLKMMAPGLLVVCAGAALLAGWKMGVVLMIFGGPMVLLCAAGVQLTYVWPMIRKVRRMVRDPAKVVWVGTYETVGRRSGIVHEHLTLGLESGEAADLQTSHLTLEEQAALVDELRALV